MRRGPEDLSTPHTALTRAPSPLHFRFQGWYWRRSPGRWAGVWRSVGWGSAFCTAGLGFGSPGSAIQLAFICMCSSIQSFVNFFFLSYSFHPCWFMPLKKLYCYFSRILESKIICVCPFHSLNPQYWNDLIRITWIFLCEIIILVYEGQSNTEDDIQIQERNIGLLRGHCDGKGRTSCLPWLWAIAFISKNNFWKKHTSDSSSL